MKIANVIVLNDTNNYKKTNFKAQQQLTEKLIYLLCGTRSDIAFAIRQSSRRNANLRVGHLKTTKQIIQYMKKTIHLGIMNRTNSSANKY